MRVICIDDSDQPIPDIPHVKKGNIYTVIDERRGKEQFVYGFRIIGGNYYILAECGIENAYHDSMFIVINEDNQDETEMQRNYQTQTV